MRAWQARLASLGDVTAFDYVYARAGRRSPDRLPVLLAAHREALAELRRRTHGPLFLIGKSMGGRMGCHVAIEEQVAGVICLGYPLKSGATGVLRDKVLLELRTPVLFVQGSRDPLCPLDLLAEVRGRMLAPSTLMVVKGGDHSLVVSTKQLKMTGDTQEHVDARVLETIGHFTAALIDPSST
jgi:predicted alpha/beta-hydrolase family hydrolase